MAFCNPDLPAVLMPQDIQCPPAFGKCIDNACVCEKGFSHDLYHKRFRDCRVPDHMLPSLIGIGIFLSTCSLIYCLRHVRAAKSLAKKIILSSALLSACFLMFMISKAATQFQLTNAGLFFLHITIGSIFMCWYLIVYSLMQPVCRLLQLPVHNKKMAMIYSFVAFRVMTTIITLRSMILFGDVTDPKNDVGWNNSLCYCEILTSLEIGLLSAGTVYSGLKMIKEIKKIEVSSTKENKFGDYIPRVQKVVDMHQMQLQTLLVSFASPVVVLVVGYIPYSFAIFAVIEFVFPYTSYKFASFAIVNKRIVEAQTGSRVASKPVTPANGGNQQLSTGSTNNHPSST